MAIVKKIKADITQNLCRGESVYTLELTPQGRAVKFSPGQFLHLALDPYDPSQSWPESRCFSIQSSPRESVIRLTYAIKGSFTQRMAQVLKVGNQVDLKLPYGDLFTQAHSKVKAVFIAGGTGITPFLSLFSHSSFVDYVQPYLYYGVRTVEHDYYQHELIGARELNKSFTVKRYVENIEGFVKIETVVEQSNLDSYYFISGPPQMINWSKASLKNIGVSEDHILTDDWE